MSSELFHRSDGKPILLDCCCCAGGCTKGYQRAGFYVVGIDVNPQPNYCGDEFHQADAIEVLETLIAGGTWQGYRLEDFAAFHASPPCQMYSRSLKHMSAPQPMLIDAFQALFVASGVPWIIENVEGAPIPYQSDLLGRHGVMLCGTSFGMRVYRHRLFEASFPLEGKPCQHTRPAMNPHNVAGRERMYAEFGRGDPEKVWLREMGVEWMGRYEGREAIPPAFTEYLGRQMLAHLDAEDLQEAA